MKTIIFSILTVISSFAFAGGSGGGGVMTPNAGALKVTPDQIDLGQFRNSELGQNIRRSTNGGGVFNRRPEIVYNLGNKDGIVRFGYAQLVDQNWQVQNIEMPEADLMKDVSVIKALKDSKALNDWAEIK